MGCCQLLSDDACISPIWIRGRQGAQVHSRSSLLLHAAAEVTRSSAAPWKFRFPATVGLVVVGVFFAATDSPCKNRAGSRNCSLRWGSPSLVSAPARSSVVCVAVLSSCLPTWAGPDRRSIILRDNFTGLSLSTVLQTYEFPCVPLFTAVYNKNSFCQRYLPSVFIKIVGDDFH